MRGSAALLLSLALAGALRADAPGGPATVPSPASVSTTAQARPGLALALAQAVDAGSGAVRACLGSLDGGPLSLALERAARAGRPLSLVLDPGDAATRAVGRALRARFPQSVRLRWLPGLRFHPRLLALGAAKAWGWAPGASEPALRASGPALQDFGRVWDRALPAVPAALALDDALKALPDPSDQTPHYTRRAPQGAPGGAP